ncbi:MAG: helix-turn-helix domain-containing protein [Arachidicoccus sp.]
MTQYHNLEFTKKVGVKIKTERESLSLEIEDVAGKTGFHRNVIISIENGSNTDISHIAAIAFALDLHPKVLFDVDVEIKSRFKLSVTRREKSRLTSRITDLYSNGFFNLAKTSKDVHIALKESHSNSSSFDTKSISVILKRLCDNGKLEFSKKDGTRYNYYKKKKRIK